MIMLYRRQYRKVLRTELDLVAEIHMLDANYDAADKVGIEELREYYGCCSQHLKCELNQYDITMGSA